MQPSNMTWGESMEYPRQLGADAVQREPDLEDDSKHGRKHLARLANLLVLKLKKIYSFKNIALLMSRILPFVPEIRIIQETYIWSKSYRDRTLNLRLGFQCVAECCDQLFCVYNCDAYDRLFGALR